MRYNFNKLVKFLIQFFSHILNDLFNYLGISSTKQLCLRGDILNCLLGEDFIDTFNNTLIII